MSPSMNISCQVFISCIFIPNPNLNLNSKIPTDKSRLQYEMQQIQKWL